MVLPGMGSGTGRSFSGLWSNSFRVKSPRYPTGEEGDSRYSTIWELTNAGLASGLVLGVAAISGQVAAFVAGPAAIFSIIIAATAAVLTALCFAEFRSRWPLVTGNAYEYTYLSIGEVVAVLVGWSSLLQFGALVSASARAISQNVDYLLENRILNKTSSAIGYIELFQSYPDFLAGGVVLVAMAAVVCGYKPHKLTSIVSNVALVLVVLFVLIVGIFHLHFDLWANTLDFFPFGFEGVLEGAATFFFAFSNFEVICSKSDVTSPSTKWATILALAVVMATCLVLYIGVASVLTLVADIGMLHTESPFPEAFTDGGMPWIKFIFCGVVILLLCIFTCSALCQVYQFLFGLSMDALLCAKFSEVNDRTNTAIVSAIASGLIAAIFAVLFNLTNLLQVASLACLLVSIVTCAAALCIRYRPCMLVHSPEHTTRKDREARRRYLKKRITEPDRSSCYGTVASNKNRDDCPILPLEDTDEDDEMIGAEGSPRHVHLANSKSDDGSSSDTDIDEVVEEYKEKLRVAALTSCTFTSSNPEIPSDATARRAAWAIVAFVWWLICLSAILAHGVDKVKHGNVGVIMLLVTFLILTLLSLLLLLHQPQEPTSVRNLYIHTPLSPWIPLVAIILDVHLILCLPFIVWVQALILLFVGALVYFLYGIHNSRASHFYQFLPEEERVLLPEPPRHQVEPRLLRNHSPPFQSSSYHPANTQTQPIFLSQEIDTVLIE